jgi:tRNA-specific 2-thiouridylase
MGFDHIATGHYARIIRAQGRVSLARARDPVKDQSYFLYSIPRTNLDSIIFPLGDFVKDETRRKAEAAGLPVADKPESQDICFVTEGSYRDFLAASATPGDIVDLSGTVLGRHTGIVNYTVGQRRGLGIARGRPLYVVAIDRGNNRLVVGDEDDLFSRGLYASGVNLLTDVLPGRAGARIRYAGQGVDCSVEFREERLRLEFDEPQRAVTPGQSAVLYSDDVVLGGGIIESAIS